MRRPTRVAFSPTVEMLRTIGMLAMCMAWAVGSAHAAAILSATGDGAQAITFGPTIVSDTIFSPPGGTVQAGDAGAVGFWIAAAGASTLNGLNLIAIASATRLDGRVSVTPNNAVVLCVASVRAMDRHVGLRYS